MIQELLRFFFLSFFFLNDLITDYSLSRWCQWQRIHLSMQETCVWSLGPEDPPEEDLPGKSHGQKHLSGCGCRVARSWMLLKLLSTHAQDHWLSRHEFEQAQGGNGEQGSLSCWSSWGHRELGNSCNWTTTTIFLNLFLFIINFQKITEMFATLATIL